MRLIVIAALLLATSCKQEPAKPKGVMERLEAGNLDATDLKIVTDEFPGMTKACVEKIRIGGTKALPKRTEDCFEMMPQQRWTGLWRNNYEGSDFCPAPARECPDGKPGDFAWLTLPDPMAKALQGRGGLYALDFIGRRTLHPGRFGSYGSYAHEMIVDRIISMKEVEPMFAENADDGTNEWMIAEEAKGTFIPSAEGKKRLQEYLIEKAEKAPPTK
jgi:hypothetical protein